jgi:hypothetical protein
MAFKVPNTTSTNKDEYKADKYVIPFAPELIKFILEDKKMTTYRFGDKYSYLQPGDRIKVQDSNTKDIVTNAVITRKTKATFAELPVSTGSHESYTDKEHQRNVLSGYYAYIGRKIKDDDPFLIFSFKLV